MKYAQITIALLLASPLLAGCATGLLGRGPATPQAAVSAPSGGNLALPPDLQLPAPGSGVTRTAAVQSGAGSSAGVYGTEPGATPAPRRRVGGVTCTNGTQAADMFECYGINKLKPDGTKKNPAELNIEMRTAVLAEKRRANPRYGTIGNWGELFN